MKNGRSVVVPHLGTFTFTYPEVNLRVIIELKPKFKRSKGTTNEFTRNKEMRSPIFIVSQDFANGMGLKSGMFTRSGIVPYSALSQDGILHKTNLNLIEIACETNTSKDDVKVGLQQIIRELTSQAKSVLKLPVFLLRKFRNNLSRWKSLH